MYSESDLNGAVEAGVISPDQAAAFRNLIAGQRAAPAVDEESFRLLTGFNDIFVTIAIAAVLVGLAWLGQSVTAGLGGALVAIASWGLAEYFTRKRRMALPSILLLLGFAGGVGATMIGTMVELNPDLSDQASAAILAGFGLVTAFATWLHWRRFMVPITVAAGAVTLVGVGVALLLAVLPVVETMIYPVLFVAGLAVFAVAMLWDTSDRERRTRRSDVAFWLHLAAAPLIAHPVFHMLGVFNGDIAPATAVIVLALYVGFAIVALAVDRRALLVSSLIYVLYAMYALFTKAGAVELGAAFTALLIGSALLTLSAFWQPARRLVLGGLGGLSERLPPAQMPVAA